MVSVVLVGLSVELSGQSVMEQELKRRRDSIIAAEEAILAGDEAYISSDFQKAVSKYREAFSKLPEGDKTDQFRNAARERYAQAAVQAARVLNRQGDREAAILMVDEVLGENVSPDYFPAQKLRAQLDDPIRTNPVATKEHAQKTDEVRRLLYQAEGAYNLAKYDESIATYQKVLRIDPYNKAARRGMERNNAKISEYSAAAQDHTRAELLSQVDAGWELKTNPKPQSLLGGLDGGEQLSSLGTNIDSKLDNIVVPFVDFEGTSLEEAIEFLEGQSRALDPELNVELKGIDFVLDVGRGDSPEVQELLSGTFSLRLRNVPLREVLTQVTRQTGTSFRVDRFAIVIQPLGSISDDLIVRRYQVPPSFLTQTASASTDDGDPFSDSADSGLKLAPRLTAREYFEQQGVSFPEGASASYSAGSNTLTVKNTALRHNEIQSIIDAVSLEEPFAVVIETKIFRVSQVELEELGFETAIETLAASGDFAFGGGTVGNGIESDFLSSQPISSGLRSGDFAVEGDAIDGLLEETFSELGTPDSAPGILSLVGQTNSHGLSVLLRGLNQSTGIDKLSQPSVVTRSGQQAIIEAVTEFIYPTEYEPPELPNRVGTSLGTGDALSFPVTPAHPTAFETRKLGTILEVQPTVSVDRTYTDLAFNIRIDEFLGFINYGTPIGDVTENDILQPLFDSVRLNTNVSVASGRTIVVGGLLTEGVETVEDKVPLLGDIPFLGRFFTSDVLQREKEAIVIFVTVRIVDPGGNPVQN